VVDDRKKRRLRPSAEARGLIVKKTKIAPVDDAILQADKSGMKSMKCALPIGKLHHVALLTVFLASIVSIPPLLADDEGVQDGPLAPYPEGYRAWRVIKVRIVGPESSQFSTRGGIHLFFANDKAVAGFRAGHFADGSTFVEEIVRPKEGVGPFKGTQADGERVSIDVKVKNEALFNRTGGWGFDTFKGDDKVSAINESIRGRCYACHTSQKDRDFTFTEIRQ